MKEIVIANPIMTDLRIIIGTLVNTIKKTKENP